MADDERPGDPWLTVAEIAEELRVNPATVRLWISKELLPAKRAGRRKLLVRRSDLDEMLRAQEQAEVAAQPVEPPPRSTESGSQVGSVSRIRSEINTPPLEHSEAVKAALRLMDTADEVWDRSVDSSVFAPPDADFPYRVRSLAIAASAQGRALTEAARIPTMVRSPGRDLRGEPISPELRPGANRPGPRELWVEFDRRVERVWIAVEAGDLGLMGARWQNLAEIMHEIAEALLGDEETDTDADASEAREDSL